MFLFVISLTGLTELGSVALMQEKGHTNHDSCGIIANNVEMKMINLCTGETLGANQKGEILIKQTNMMKHYYKNPKATQETIDSDGKSIKAPLSLKVKQLC